VVISGLWLALKACWLQSMLFATAIVELHF
jgi:hypothetical protein